MSFVDTVGPFVLCLLLGIAGVLAAVGVLVGYTAKHLSRSRSLIEYNRAAQRFVDEVIAEAQLNGVFAAEIPARLLDQAYALKDFHLKEIYK